jgi:hypothetical protein
LLSSLSESTEKLSIKIALSGSSWPTLSGWKLTTPLREGK